MVRLSLVGFVRHCGGSGPWRLTRAGAGQCQRQRRQFHFGSRDYAKAFLNLPQPNVALLRETCQEYLKAADPQLWYADPIVSLLQGHKLQGSVSVSVAVDTTDAFGQVSGRQYWATPEQVTLLKNHIATYKSPSKDLRSQLRRIEDALLTDHAGFLIGNQSLDFGKQDGITEMEESVMANAVERRLNDLLLHSEQAGKIHVNRQPIYVSCVSNFTNFLDLFRKTLRSLEVGIPCVVLSRTNTQQHSYRWTLLLTQLMAQEGIDPGMLTFVSASLPDILDITQSCKSHTGNLYSTCSRTLALAMTQGYPKTVASTGGPNTLVATEWTPAVAKAAQMSATIESAGQCTALRHCVVPSSVDNAALAQVFDDVQQIPSPQYALEHGIFDGVVPHHKGSVAPTTDTGYIRHDKVDAYYRIGHEPPCPRNDNQSENEDLPEYWRKVVVDFTKMDLTHHKKSPNVDSLAAWLNQHQPISLAINGPRETVFELAVQLFDRTGMVVYTIGSTDSPDHPPAMTCQARPQEAEVFGEFPPRHKLTRYTRFPVVVPSSTPSYDAEYASKYLESLLINEYFAKSTKELLKEITDQAIRGYCIEVIHYLQDATMQNPKLGFGTSRTALWGLQRPPLGTKTWIRCNSTATWDAVAPVFMLFFVTNARDQVQLSLDPANDALVALCNKHGLQYSTDTDEAFASKSKDAFNVVPVGNETTKSFPMAGQFVSLYLPLGHIKSTMPKDDEFVMKLSQLSNKWLTTLF